MRRNDPNLPALRAVAQALGDLREQVVFLGGAVAGLLVTDPLAEGVRATIDVDAVTQAGRAEFQRLQRELTRRGFREDADSSVICRWIHRDSGVVFDLMPETPDVRPDFLDMLPGLIAEPERADMVAGRLSAIAEGRKLTEG